MILVHILLFLPAVMAECHHEAMQRLGPSLVIIVRVKRYCCVRIYNLMLKMYTFYFKPKEKIHRTRWQKLKTICMVNYPLFVLFPFISKCLYPYINLLLCVYLCLICIQIHRLIDRLTNCLMDKIIHL